ncbi:zinc finger protein 709-like [Rhagoletis pomonella]|uniref:zinc finger protein 709-like n=1 Tax=Rhagoletis pomonella TaxID=28610 RepID=UPI001785E901|nr:zinc finger protein 709-like [Rhagoletis pomonella]
MQCRACMQMDCVGGVEMSSAVSADGKTLYDYFNDCTQLHATSTDNLPQLLCLNCTQIVRSAYNFKEIARRSDEELRNILVFPKTEPEMIYANTEQPQDAVECTNDPLATIQPSPVAIESLMSIPELDIPTIDIKFENPEELCQESQGDERGDSEVLRDRVTHPCNLCDCIYTTKKELKNHIFDMHKPHIICIKCPKFFDFPKELQLHESLVHATESPMQCPWCKEYHPREVFNKHLRSKHSNSYSKYFPGNEIGDRGSGENTSFRCEHCEKYFSSVLELADHIQEHTFDCPLCSKRFKKYGTFRAHVKRKHNHSINSLKAITSEEKDKNKPFQCSICSTQFKQQRSFRDHMKRKHNQIIKKPEEEENKPFKCSLCSRQFNQKRSFKDHMKRKHIQSIKKHAEDDEEDKPYNCPICNMCFKSHSAVYCHKRRKHPDSATTAEGHINASSNIGTEKVENENTENSELIRCKFCNKEIPGNRIKYHEKRHIYALNRKRKYLCSFCPREFNSGTSVKLHEKKIHLREKPEPKECPICQKEVDPNYLKHHIDNVHASERKFICAFCGDSFRSNVLLHYHKRLHLERKFPCTICTKKFIRSNELKVHMRSHTGEEPYACHICDRRFKIKVRLNYHLQRHAGIKRKCKECGKEFNHVKQLKIHSYKHTGMPYRCSVCSYACAQRDVFRNHLLRMHDMTMTPDEYCAMFKANTGRNPHVKTLEELQSGAQNMEQEELLN